MKVDKYKPGMLLLRNRSNEPIWLSRQYEPEYYMVVGELEYEQNSFGRWIAFLPLYSLTTRTLTRWQSVALYSQEGAEMSLGDLLENRFIICSEEDEDVLDHS